MHPRNILALAAGGLLLGCGLNQEGVPPPENKIAFPASALLDTTGRWLYVTNSNSDLRYNDGTLVAVDTQSAEADRADGRGPVPARLDGPEVAWVDCKQVDHIDPNSPDNAGHCCWDLLDRNILNCDERRYVDARATVRIGSFASGMVMQLPEGSCSQPTPKPDNSPERPCSIGCTGANQFAERLYIGVRGNSSVTWVDVTHEGGDVQFHCTTPVESPPTCGASHQVVRAEMSNVAASTLLPDEPYAMTLDPASQLLYVGHLKGDIGHPGSGGISMLDVSTDQPRLVYPLGSIFPPDGNGFFGVTSLTLDGGAVYASSRYVPRVGAVVHTDPKPGTGCTGADQLALIPTGETFDTALGGSEIRGIQFVPDADRAFVLQRNPPALIGFRRDTRIPSEVIETCSSPTFLQAYNPAGQGTRLFITCFESGQVYVVDPYVPRLIDVIEVGRGPAGLVFKSNPERAYVVGFGENNISVVDLQPGSPTELHVIQRLGYPSAVPR